MGVVRVMLDYIHPWPNAAGLFVALERGWYREAGLEVDLVVHGYGRGDTLAFLARGEVDFGLFPPNRLLVRRQQGERLVGIAAVNQCGLETIQLRRDSGIDRPRQLEGRRVAFAPTPRGRAMVSHLVRIDGGDPERVVTVDSAERELTPEYLLESGADATFGGYFCWDLLSDRTDEKDFLTWRVQEIGAPPYPSYLFGTQEWQAERNPTFVRAFLAATARGYRQAATDAEGTLALLARAIPYQPRWRLARSLALVAPTWFDEGRWGWQGQDDVMAPYAAFLAEYGVLSDAAIWRTATTNEYLPETG